MLSEIRSKSFHTLKEFLREYFMVVVGILTALGLEHKVTHDHHVRAAEESRLQIVAELRANLKEVRDSRQQNAERLKQLPVITQTLAESLRAHRDKATINRDMLKLMGKYAIGYAWPTLRHEGWDVVVANQSASYIEQGRLRRYSAAYASQRDASALALQSASALLNGPRLLDAMTELEAQQVDPMELLKVLKHLTASINSVQSNILELEGQLEKALQE
jgi:hypothetical protein